MKRLTNQQRLLGGAAAAVIIVGGFGALSMTRNPEAAPQAAADAEEEHGAGEALEMDAARIQAAGIILAPVGSGSLSAEIVAQGTVVGTPQGEAVLAARADGVITAVSLRLGESVRAGQTVALIESREASSIAAERATAQARLTAARQALAREQRLFDSQITARQDLEASQTVMAEAEAEARRTSSAAAAARVSGDGRSTGVVSPISGRVTVSNATAEPPATSRTEESAQAPEPMAMAQTPFSAAETRMHEAMAAAAGADAAESWARKMIPHHQGALDMSQVVLRETQDADIRRMAQKTVEMQTGDIAELRRWLETRVGAAAPGGGGEPPFAPAEARMMDAMMTAAGANTDQTWASKMIAHHQGALDMSEVVLRESQDPGIRRMAQKTIDMQTADIGELRAWLQAHPANPG
ncbi:MAG: DUF305 domain-containing protein [Brevundimonas sp.]|uniref:DUF305 domain-containing protein n=1 Tax=Brevundimonas sp. TaxID=1871086 RepID=UPI0024890051|nr:DUF305 domain-containing protein [Brevundimonas sp.]MDI1328211.1 DUF305 domain-containing protein [Brevundimonas sp.]